MLTVEKEIVTVVARVRRADFRLGKGIIPELDARFELEDGRERPMTGYAIDIDFLCRFLGVWRAESLAEVVGQACRLTMEERPIGERWGDILRIEPLLPGEGKVFDVWKWSALCQRRDTVLGMHGLRLWGEAD